MTREEALLRRLAAELRSEFASLEQLEQELAAAPNRDEQVVAQLGSSRRLGNNLAGEHGSGVPSRHLEARAEIFQSSLPRSKLRASAPAPGVGRDRRFQSVRQALPEMHQLLAVIMESKPVQAIGDLQPPGCILQSLPAAVVRDRGTGRCSVHRLGRAGRQRDEGGTRRVVEPRRSLH